MRTEKEIRHRFHILHLWQPQKTLGVEVRKRTPHAILVRNIWLDLCIVCGKTRERKGWPSYWVVNEEG